MKSTTEPLPAQSEVIAPTEQLKRAWARSEPVNFGDPLLARMELGLQKTFFPFGFPLVMSTNSCEVLDAAAESWSNFEKLFDTEPIRVSVGVTGDASHECPPTPINRMREHINSNIADGENFSIADLRQGFSMIWLTSAAIEHRSYFRYFFLESTAMCHIANRFTTGIHAACVELNGTGILLCGDSGAGKSTLSYACARAGWTFITDDGSYLVNGRDDRLVVGNGGQVRFRVASESFFPELRGKPKMRRAEVGKPSIELATSSNDALSTANTARIRHVVFLNRNSGKHEITSFPVGVARLYMLQRMSGSTAIHKTQVQMIDHLLEVGALELHYTDLDWAVHRLGSLVHEGV